MKSQPSEYGYAPWKIILAVKMSDEKKFIFPFFKNDLQENAYSKFETLILN